METIFRLSGSGNSLDFPLGVKVQACGCDFCRLLAARRIFQKWLE